MISDSEKQKIMESIMQAFNQWGRKYYQNLFVKSDSQDFSNAFKTAVKEQGFLEKRALELGLYMEVLESCVSNKTIYKYRKIIIESCILSIVDGSFTIPDLLQKDTNNQLTEETALNRGYTRRHMQRLLHERFKELYSETDLQINSKDERLNHFSSIFTEMQLPEDSAGVKALTYLKSQQNMLISNHIVLEKLSWNSVLRFAFPTFLEDLIKFKEECKAIFENLGRRDDRIDFLREQLTEFTPALTVFYSNLISVLAVEWFRQKSEKNQITVLDSKFKFNYNESDAEKARNLLVSITDSNEYSSFFLSYCANAFVYFKRPLEAISLFEQSRNITNKEFEKGILSQNIAVEYRENGNFKLMLGEAKMALSYYEKSSKTYYVCLAHKLIGEAQYRLGFKESAINSFQSAEKLANEIEQDKWKVLMNIGISFDRLGETHLRDKYLVKCLQLIPEDQTETILGIERMLGSR